MCFPHGQIEGDWSVPVAHRPQRHLHDLSWPWHGLTSDLLCQAVCFEGSRDAQREMYDAPVLQSHYVYATDLSELSHCVFVYHWNKFLYCIFLQSLWEAIITFPKGFVFILTVTSQTKHIVHPNGKGFSAGIICRETGSVRAILCVNVRWCVCVCVCVSLQA